MQTQTILQNGISEFCKSMWIVTKNWIVIEDSQKSQGRAEHKWSRRRKGRKDKVKKEKRTREM